MQSRRNDSQSSDTSEASFIEAHDDDLNPINIADLTETRGQVIYNDPENNLQLEVKRKRHVRETNYLDDHLFEITIKEIHTRAKRPLLVDLLLIFLAALQTFLRDIASFYDQVNNHQMYVTVIDENIRNGLNTGNFNVHTNPEVVATHVLNMLYNFLTSHMSLKLNNSFRFNIKVLSLRHANDRIQRGSLRPHLLGGYSTTAKKGKYLLCLPKGFEDFENVFAQNCGLIAIILGHFLNESIEFGCTKFNEFKLLCNPDKSKEAGQSFLSEVTKICEILSLDFRGPHSLEEIAPKLFGYFQDQLIVIDSGLNKVVFRYPPIYNESLRHIFLLQELDEFRSHISLIEKVKLFQRLNGIICLFCDKQFHGKSLAHLCKSRETCPACLRFVLKDNTKILPNNQNLFCKREVETVCQHCAAKTFNQLCQKIHKCLAFKCHKCDKMIPVKKSSLKDRKKSHQCEEFHCKNCNTIVISGKDKHICRMKKTKLDQNQPALAFLNLQIVDENNADCYECFLKKDSLRQTLQLTWEQMILKLQSDSEIISKSLCQVHQLFGINTSNERHAMLASVRIEKNARNIFETHIFADDALEKLHNLKPEQYSSLYSDIKISRKPIKQKYGKHYRGTELEAQNLEAMKRKAKQSVLEKLLSFLLCAFFYNTTLICFGSEDMLLVYKTFLDNGLQCKTICKGQNLIYLEYEKFQLRVLDLKNYVTSSFHSLIVLFDLELLPTYFPEKLKRKENFSMTNLSKDDLPLQFFYQFNDSDEEKKSKLTFWQNMPSFSWDFQNELLKHSINQLNILSEASFQFVRQCDHFQKNLSQMLKTNCAEMILTLPFARPFCTVSSFFYNMFKMHILDTRYQIFIVPNEYPKKIQSSKEELEYAAYLQYLYPGKKFNNAFSKKNERNFGRAIADIYCKDEKAIWFFNECCIHGHQPEDCSITSKRKTKSCFGRSFDMLNKEFFDKLTSIQDQFNEITVMWQCEWRKAKEEDQHLKHFLENVYIPWPSHHLSPREAVRGARIETFGLKWTSKLNSDEKLFFVDCSSLYPFSR